MSLVSRRQRAKKEFPFTFALCAALALHFLIGVAIKRNMLIAANPVPPAPPSKAPVTMRFVEVPPNSKTVPVAPKTKNVSDANRKAGPLKPLNPGEMECHPVRASKDHAWFDRKDLKCRNSRPPRNRWHRFRHLPFPHRPCK